MVTHNIQDIDFDQNFIRLRIDGKQYKIPINSVSPKLKAASDLQRNFYKISPSGYGIHWPLVDEYLSISALLNVATP